MLFQNEVKLYVNRLNTQESVIPYEYSHFDFCLPDGEQESPVENLGQVVFGERIRPSPYKISFMQNETCVIACTKEYKANTDSNNKLGLLRKAISLSYKHHWIVDNMPVTTCYEDGPYGQDCTPGFPVGCFSKYGQETCYHVTENGDAYYIYNHVDLVITYHSGGHEEWGNQFGDKGGRIISVKVSPKSIKHPKR